MSRPLKNNIKVLRLRNRCHDFIDDLRLSGVITRNLENVIWEKIDFLFETMDHKDPSKIKSVEERHAEQVAKAKKVLKAKMGK